MQRPTFAEIDLPAIVHNLRALKSLVPPRVEVMAMVKADAYGHGAVEVCRALAQEGVRRFGVAILDEAVRLREAGAPGAVLVLGSFFPDEAEEIVARGFEAVVSDLGFAERLDAEARKRGATAAVHVKLDTGMGRVGFRADTAVEMVHKVSSFRSLRLVGAMTHFPAADMAEHVEFTREQVRLVQAARTQLEREGLRIPLWHAANSAAVLGHPESHLDAIRPGLALYGGIPDYPHPCPVELRQAMTLKTRVAQVRDLPEGWTVSYGRAFRASRPTRLAVLSVGYADGYDRRLSNIGVALVRGRRAPVAGRVCMDLTLLDVTDIPGVQPGDEVVLCGRQGGEFLSINELARTLGTIPYTLMTGLSARVPRKYVKVD